MVRIRLADDRDAAAIASIYRPFVETTAISFEVVPPSPDQVALRIRETTAVYPWLVCERNGRVVGYAYATSHRARAAYRWSCDSSVYVEREHWRCGVGRGLYASLFAVLAAQGFFNAYAGVTLPNPGSVGLHEAVGFRPVGVYQRVGFKFGAWHDVGWWQRRLKSDDDSPHEPLTLAAVRNQPAWDSLVTQGQSFIQHDQ